MTRILLLAASLGLAVSGAQACDFMKSAAKVDTSTTASVTQAGDADAADVDADHRRYGSAGYGRRRHRPAIRIGIFRPNR